MIWKN